MNSFKVILLFTFISLTCAQSLDDELREFFGQTNQEPHTLEDDLNRMFPNIRVRLNPGLIPSEPHNLNDDLSPMFPNIRVRVNPGEMFPFPQLNPFPPTNAGPGILPFPPQIPFPPQFHFSPQFPFPPEFPFPPQFRPMPELPTPQIRPSIPKLPVPERPTPQIRPSNPSSPSTPKPSAPKPPSSPPIGGLNNKEECTCRLRSSSRIVNGQISQPNSIPWQVSLAKNNRV